MINIEIQDVTRLSQKELTLTAKYLMEFAGHEIREAPSIQSPIPAPPGKPFSTPEQEAIKYKNDKSWGGVIQGKEEFINVRDAEIPAHTINEQLSSLPEMNKMMEQTKDELLSPTDINLPNANVETAPIEPLTPPPPLAAEVFKKPMGLIVPPPPKNIEYDAEGQPWDYRIHTRTKAKTTDGRWKLSRGVDPAIVAGVRAETAKVLEIPPILEADPTAPVLTFGELTMKITNAIRERKLNQVKLNSVLNAFGIPSLPLLGARPDLFGTVAAKIDEVILNG
jgi:hypothetical protein